MGGDTRAPAWVFSQPKVQKLTLLDVSEVEKLSALIEQGHSIIELLNAKTNGPYSEMDFTRFVYDTPSLSHEVRSSLLERRWKDEIVRTAESFGFDPNSAEAIEATRGVFGQAD